MAKGAKAIAKGLKYPEEVLQDITSKTVVSNIGHGVNIVKNFIKITRCIQSHLSIYAEAEEARNAANQIYENTKLAYYQIRNFQEKIIVDFHFPVYLIFNWVYFNVWSAG